MKPTYYLMIILFIAVNVQAQVGINNIAPDSSSILDISSTNKGLLIPRVALQSLTDNVTILNPTNSLLVYNRLPINNIKEGYYYWSTPLLRWIKILSELDKPGVIFATFDSGKTDIKTAAHNGNKSFNFQKIDFNSVVGATMSGTSLVLPAGDYMIESSVNINRDNLDYYVRVNGINKGIPGTIATVKTQAEIVNRLQQAVFTLNTASVIDFYPTSTNGGTTIPVDPALSYMKITKF